MADTNSRPRSLLSAQVDKQTVDDFRRIAHGTDRKIQDALDEALKDWADKHREAATQKVQGAT